MGMFRKKPVVIEARQVPSFEEEAKDDAWELVLCDLCEWCDSVYDQDGWIIIATLEGDMRASSGDWIIKGVNGEFYPCKPDIFEKTYEAVVDEDAVLRGRSLGQFRADVAP